jgi:hypothetical protein
VEATINADIAPFQSFDVREMAGVAFHCGDVLASVSRGVLCALRTRETGESEPAGCDCPVALKAVRYYLTLWWGEVYPNSFKPRRRIDIKGSGFAKVCSSSS